MHKVVDPYEILALQPAVGAVWGGTGTIVSAFTMGNTVAGMQIRAASGETFILEVSPRNWRKSGEVVAKQLTAASASPKVTG